MLLNEIIIEKPLLETKEQIKLPDGVLCRVTYPICNINQRNANNRMYERAVWDRVMEDKDLQHKLESRALFGHAEHPEQTASDLGLTSHVIHKMWIDESKNICYQTLDVLDTPGGRIVDTLLRAGCQCGVSTRAEGDLEECEDDQGKFHKVIPEKYKYVSTDFTADPSTFDVIPLNVKRNVVFDTKKELERKDLKENERKYINEMLNSMKCKNEKCQGCGACDKVNEKKINEETKKLLYIGLCVNRIEEECIVFVYEGHRAETVVVDGVGYASPREEAVEKGRAIAKILGVIFKLGVEESIMEVINNKINEKEVVVVASPETGDVAVTGDVKSLFVSPNPSGTEQTVNIRIQSKPTPVITEPVPAEPKEVPVELEDEVEELTVEEPEDVESETPEEEEVSEDLSVPEKHQLKIAKDTLKMSDEGAHIMGGMTKEEARLFLKKQGWSDEKIAKLEESKVNEIEDNEKEYHCHKCGRAQTIERGKDEIKRTGQKDVLCCGEPMVLESKDIKIGDTFKFAGQEYTVVKLGPEIVDVEYIVAYGEQKGKKFRTPWTRKAVEDFINRSVDATESKINETENINKMYQAAGLPVPDGKGIHTEAFHKLAIEVAKGYIKSGDSPEEALKKAYPTAMKQLGKEKAVKKSHQSEAKVDEKELTLADHAEAWWKEKGKIVPEKGTEDWDQMYEEWHAFAFKDFPSSGEIPEKHNEFQEVNSVLKDVTELKIKEATARAEKDAVVEAFSSDKDFDLEVKMLTSRLRKSVDEKNVSSTEVTSLCSVLEKKAEQIKSLSSELVETNKVKDELVKVNAELIEAKNTINIIKVKNDAVVKVFESNINGAKAKIKDVQVNCQQLVKEYVDLKLKSSRLMADTNTRALLESSTSLKQVNEKFDELLDVARVSALHSNMVNEVIVSKPLDSKTMQIDRAVGSVFEGFGYKVN